MFSVIATLKRNNSMEASKTVEELMKGIRSLAKDIDWDNSEGKGVICFAHEENETMCIAYGQYSSVACAITNMMIDDENIRDIMCLAYKNLRSGKLNTGLTYASRIERETVIVVSRASCAEEYFNSIVHEIAHAGVYTCDALGIELKSEEAAYFQGGLARDLFPCIKDFLCECCLKAVRREH